MRCSCCNKRLTDYESTLKHAVTGAYLDTCLDCLSDIAQDVPMPVKANKNHLPIVDFDEGVDNDDEMCYPTLKNIKDNRDYEEDY